MDGLIDFRLDAAPVVVRGVRAINRAGDALWFTLVLALLVIGGVIAGGVSLMLAPGLVAGQSLGSV